MKGLPPLETSDPSSGSNLREAARTPSKWCPLPWKGLLIKNTGEMRVCIQANQAGSTAAALGDDGSPLKIQSNELKDFQNSSLLRSLRLSMLRDEEHPHCVRCDLEEKSGLSSARTNQRALFADSFSFEDSLSQTLPDGSVQEEKTKLGFADLRLGNHCNLKCRMCGPSESSGWYEEHFHTVGSGFRLSSEKVKLEISGNKVSLKEGSKFTWIESSAAWTRLENGLNQVKILHMVGGEPFLEERQISILHKLVESGRSKSIILDYNSNLSVIPQQLRSLWKNFYEVRIGASIDGIEKFHEYIRFPSKWKTVEKNFLDLALGESNILIWPTTTVQILNAYEILDVYRWRLKNRILSQDWRPSVPLMKIHPVHNPEYYSIRSLPKEEKARLEKTYHKFLESFLKEIETSDAPREVKDRWSKSTREDLLGLIRFLYSKDSVSTLSEFWNRNQKMDLYRQQSFSQLYPEFSARLRAYSEQKEVPNGATAIARA